MNKAGKKVIVTFDMLEIKQNNIGGCIGRNLLQTPEKAQKNCKFSEETLKNRHPYLELYDKALSGMSDVCVFYQSDLFRGENNLKIMDSNGYLLMRDNLHLSEYGSQQMSELFKKSKCFSENKAAQ